MPAGNPSIAVRGGLAAVFALFAIGALAQAAVVGPTFSIRQHRVPNALLSNWNLTVSGQWPSQCPPALEGVSLDGLDLRIDSRSVLGLCERREMPFSIELNPALALNRQVLPPGIYHVSFYAADGAEAQPALRAFALIDRSPIGATPIVPETGFWWSANAADSEADRSVLSIELQADQLSVALMSYDGTGQPVWYFGAATYAGHIASIPLLRLSGGSGPFSPAPAQPHGNPALNLDLQFVSAAHANAWLTRPAGNGALQLQSLDLVRLPMAESIAGQTWQGDWVLVSDAPGATPQRLRLDNFQSLDAEHFQLSDDAGTTLLVCSREPGQPDWPPTACTLQRSTLADATIYDFDSVAITRLDGSDHDGTAVHLLRVSR